MGSTRKLRRDSPGRTVWELAACWPRGASNQGGNGVRSLAVDVPLFEVVPWKHGYAHSWALRWAIDNRPAARDALLALFLPEGDPPWSVEGVTREFRVGRNRADLRFDAVDSAGRTTVVLIETKVNEDLSERQLLRYCSEAAEVIVYAPGLTGLLHAGSDPVDRERWVTGRQVTDALAGLELPDLIHSYLNEVALQADRMDAARSAVRGEQADFDRADDISEVSANDIEAVAWVAEVAGAMRARGAEHVKGRNTAHDYGVFWAGSWQPIAAGRDHGVYVDVVVNHGGRLPAITVKVGGGGVADRRATFKAAMVAGAPWEGWRKGKHSSAANFRLWSLDGGEMSVPEAAEAALRVADYLGSLAQSRIRMD